jgi:hypothetical protein
MGNVGTVVWPLEEFPNATNVPSLRTANEWSIPALMDV